MAKLTVEVEENQFALYNYETFVNGELWRQDENFTSEETAISAAFYAFEQGWRNVD